MKRSATALLLSLGLAGAAHAQSDSDMTELYPNFTFNNVGQVLNGIGYQTNVRQMPNGGRTLEVRTADDFVFYAEPQACSPNGGNCVGLVMFAFYQKEGGYDLDTINTFNSTYFFTKVQRDADGDAMLSRYIISDFGIPKGNIAVNAQVFVELSQRFGKAQTGDVTASAETAAPAPAAVGGAVKASSPAEEAIAHVMELKVSGADYDVNK